MKKLTLLMMGIFLIINSCATESIDQDLERNAKLNNALDNQNSSCNDCDGKINYLELQYNGSADATIVVETKKVGENGSKIVFDELVEAGDSFEFSGNDKKGTLGTEISIYINGELNAKLHTSCSVPVGPGLLFGDFEIISGTSRNGGKLCPVDSSSTSEDCSDCDGKINYLELQYNGSADATIVVETKKVGENGSKIVFNEFVEAGDTFEFSGNDKKGTLGTEIFIYVNGELNTTLHTSCSVPVGSGLVFGDFEVISGTSRNGGELCPIDSSPTSDDCSDCDGKINYMELLYNGDDDATIVVETKKVGENGSKIVFNDFVDAGATFEFSGNDKKGTLGTEIFIYINGELNTTLHTSCSVPVGPGLVFGDFEVIRATSRNGGELCPLDTDPPNEGCPCNGNIIQMILIYDGPANATVSVGIEGDGSDTLQVFNNAQPGDILNVQIGNVGDWWYYSVNGNVDASINTSCEDNILGNTDATMSDFGSLGSGSYSNPSQGNNNATFFIYSHTDSNGNTCTASIG